MKKWLGVAIIFAAIIFVVLWIRFSLKPPSKVVVNYGPLATENLPPQPSSSITVNSDDRKTYRNDTYGIEFSYPGDLILEGTPYDIRVVDNTSSTYLEMYVWFQNSDADRILSGSATSSLSMNGSMSFAPSRFNGIEGVEGRGYLCEGHCREDTFYFKMKNGYAGGLNLVPQKFCLDPETEVPAVTCAHPNPEVESILESFQFME